MERWKSPPFAESLEDAFGGWGYPELATARQAAAEEGRPIQKEMYKLLIKHSTEDEWARLLSKRLAATTGDSDIQLAVGAQAAKMLKETKGHTAMAAMKTMVNGWATTRRFHREKVIKCIFGCGEPDDMTHYWRCAPLWKDCRDAGGNVDYELQGHHWPRHADGGKSCQIAGRGVHDLPRHGQGQAEMCRGGGRHGLLRTEHSDGVRDRADARPRTAARRISGSSLRLPGAPASDSPPTHWKHTSARQAHVPGHASRRMIVLRRCRPQEANTSTSHLPQW